MKRFDVDDLYKHYGKTRERLTESLLTEDGKKLVGQKSNVVQYFDDPNLTPSSFQLDFKFIVQFTSEEIHADFVGVGTRAKPNPSKEMSDDDADRLAQIALQKGAEPETQPKIEKFVDYDRVWMEIIRKQLGAYATDHKVKDLQKAGIFSESLGDFKIDNVLGLNAESKSTKYDATDISDNSDEKLLLKSYMQQDRKLGGNLTPINVKYGYSVILLSTNKLPHDVKQITDISKKFISVFEVSVLKDTKYFKIIK